MNALYLLTRRGGRSLAEIAREEVGPVAGFTTAVAILFIIIIALAGLGLAVVNALRAMTAGVLSVRDNYWPLTGSADPGLRFTGYLNSSLTVLMLACVITILVTAGLRCFAGGGPVVPGRLETARD